MNHLRGVLAAAGVRMICPYIANSLHKRPNCFRVEPTEDINIPPLRVYTLIPNIGQIITKVCEPNNDENESPASKKKQESPASKKESQSSKSAKSDPQGKIELPECEDLEEDDDNADDGDEDGDDAEDGGDPDEDEETRLLNMLEGKNAARTNKRVGGQKAAASNKKSKKQ